MREQGSARTLDDQRRAAQTVAEGHHELLVASALLTGAPLPAAYVPPCFVDPTHGASTTTVDYPEAGAGVRVPVCAGCAHRRAAYGRAAATVAAVARPAATWAPPTTPTPPSAE